MRRVAALPLWIGHAGDVRDLRAIFAAGIAAVVDLAANEPPAVLARDIVYCRFPLDDGAGNPSWLLRAAVETTAGLLRAGTPTLVGCSAGMSRSPAIAAAGLALADGRPADECLRLVTENASADVCPALWRELQRLLAE